MEHAGRNGHGVLTQALCLGVASFTRRHDDCAIEDDLFKLAAFLDTAALLSHQQSSPVELVLAGSRYTALDVEFLTSLNVRVVFFYPDESLAFFTENLTRVLGSLEPSTFVLDFGITDQEELAKVLVKAGVALAIRPLSADEEFEDLLDRAQGLADEFYKHTITWQKLQRHPEEIRWPEYDGYQLPELELGNAPQLSLFVKQSRKATRSTGASGQERLAVEKLLANFRWSQKQWAESDVRRDLHGLAKGLEPERGWAIDQAITLATGSFSMIDDMAHKSSDSFFQLAAFLDAAQNLCGVTRSMRLIAQDPVYTYLDLLFLRELGIEPFRGGMPDSDLPDAVDLITARTLVCE